MTCSKAKKFIPFLAHVELNKSNREALNQHLRNCPRCQAIADEYGTLAKMTSSIPGATEPPQFYETFFQEIQQRISQDFQPANTKSNLTTHSKWSILNPRFALVGMVILFTIIICSYFFTHNYFSQLKHRPTLEAYLSEFNYRGLIRAIKDNQQQAKLMSDSVSVDLLVQSLKRLQRFDMRHGQVGRFLANTAADIEFERQKYQGSTLDEEQQKAITSAQRLDFFRREFDFDAVLKALRKLNRSGARVSLKDLLNLKDI